MKLTEKSMEVLNYVKTNGGKVSIGANVTDLTKKELAAREKVEVEGMEKPVTYVVLSDAGMAWVPTEDAE